MDQDRFVKIFICIEGTKQINRNRLLLGVIRYSLICIEQNSMPFLIIIYIYCTFTLTHSKKPTVLVFHLCAQVRQFSYTYKYIHKSYCLHEMLCWDFQVSDLIIFSSYFSHALLFDLAFFGKWKEIFQLHFFVTSYICSFWDRSRTWSGQ